MPFDMPKVDRNRLNELLNVLGDRAEDFRKCFDAELEWCWKYADLMLRGMQQRELEYAEGHHVVPACFYGKRNSVVNEGNLTTLTYSEHLYAHYCAALCGIGQMKGKMARAFMLMFNIKNSKSTLPEEQELIDSIPECEVRRIRSMDNQVSMVEAEGRTHYWEDPVQALKESRTAWKKKHPEKKLEWISANKEYIAEWYKSYREKNKERIHNRDKSYREQNKRKLAERAKNYRETNKERIAASKKAYHEANRESILKKHKTYWEKNRDKLLKRKKIYWEKNRDKLLKRKKIYYETNKERIATSQKAYYEANKERIAARQKVHREKNKDTIAAYSKAYYEANKERITERDKAFRESKKAAGYRYRKDPATGKHRWVFVGLPGTPESLCA